MSTLTDNTTAEFSIGEWAAGDDELMALDNSVEIGEAEGGYPDEQSFCPVCGENLTGVLVFVSMASRFSCMPFL